MARPRVHGSMLRKIALLLSLLVVACAPESVAPADVVVAVSQKSASPAPAVNAKASEPALRLTDVNLPAGTLAAAVSRWQTTTGLQIEIGEGGVPVSIVEDVPSPQGRVCAGTDVDASGPLSIRVDGTPPAGHGCRAMADSIAHEVGHAVCRFYAPVEGYCHSSSGLMGHREELGSAIDSTTLVKVCEFAPCAHFTPEI